MSLESYGGRYAVIELIGSGGMADVYRARDELLGREVAVKVLSERFSRDRSFVERFRREAQAAAALNHPNIVSLYDYGGDDGTYFIVMEYIDGKPLSDVIRDEGPLLPERAAEIASDVAKALERAHSAGLVHRDIKSGNIMFTSSGATKVTDFGIARALGGNGEQTMTQTGMVIGTASYLSPEQAQGNPVDARSDVYSLGVVLYEMLTGKTPFSGETPLAIAYKHVREDPVPPSRINSDVPRSLDAIVMKALAKNPDNRYSSAAEMREDLERFLAGVKVMATPVMADTTTVAPRDSGTQVMRETSVYRDEEPPRRAGLYVVIALLILGLFALLAWLIADNLLGGPDVRVPRVIGLAEDEARDRLEQEGFEVVVERRPSTEFDEGDVFRQQPRNGTLAEEGSEVTITVSQGPRQVQVPDLVDLTLEEAREILRDEGLRVGEITREPSDEVEEGIVIDQFPSADTTVDADTRVQLVVSAGPQTIVPFVEGSSEDEAIELIEAEGLVAEVLTAPSDTVDEGIVIAQDPAAGTEVEPGDVVTITVSEGPEAREMPSVVGEDADAAEAFLENDYGLDVSQVQETEACAQPPGTVCRQEPEEGTPVTAGDEATLYVQPGDAFLSPGPANAFAFLFLFG